MTNSIDQNHKKSFVMITRQMPTKGNEESGRIVHLPNLNRSESDDNHFSCEIFRKLVLSPSDKFENFHDAVQTSVHHSFILTGLEFCCIFFVRVTGCS